MRKSPGRPSSRWLPGVSRGAMAALLLAVPAGARAQFAGTPTVMRGSASFSTTGTTQTVTVGAPITTINWVPTDAAVGGPPINFLPAGTTESFAEPVGVPAFSATVLNRILPNDPTRSVAFNGSVTSPGNIAVWLYSPGGLLIGATAQFNVGSLLLTAADPVVDANGNFMATPGQFAVAAAAGSTSAITIQQGAQINALAAGQSNYVVAIAPQISQAGSISVNGSAALIAAESASFTIDTNGLFNIQVTSGTTVASNTLVNTGSVGGANAAAAGSFQRVYMVAVPKNNAITMAISAGGALGFAIADAANVSGDAIVLSAGGDVADITNGGSSNPVVASAGGTGAASLTVGAGQYTSNTYAVSTGSATVTDPAASISFASDLAVIAPTATVHAATATISVAGNLTVGPAAPAATIALAQVDAGATLAVGTNAAALLVNGDLLVSADDNFAGNGGSATINVNAGTLSVAGNASVSANGTWNTATANAGVTTTRGGTALISVSGGGTLTSGGLVSATADGDGTNADTIYTGSSNFDQGLNAYGGNASVTASGAGSSISGAIQIIASAAGLGGTASLTAFGGNATGGTALIEASNGATIANTATFGGLTADASASGGGVTSSVPVGVTGMATGGNASIIADNALITTVAPAQFNVAASATGGNISTTTGNGGSAIGGTALLATLGTSGTIRTDTGGATNVDASTFIDASAIGGGASTAGAGGSGTGGLATISTSGPGEAITLAGSGQVAINALGIGGGGNGGGGGAAIGGMAQLLALGSPITITNANLIVEANATGGAEQMVNGGAATGGTADIELSAGGTLNAQASALFNAVAVGGSAGLIFGSLGGDATGGTVLINNTQSSLTIANGTTFLASALGGNSLSGSGGTALGGNVLVTVTAALANHFDVNGVGTIIDASYTGGTGILANGTAATAGGGLFTIDTNYTVNDGVVLIGNTPAEIAAAGSINVTGSVIAASPGAYLKLLSDSQGTGTGTVTLATGAINMSGAGDAVDIFYNPTAIGTPTNYAPGVTAGTWTGYQLLDNVTQLQQAGGFLAQNFALGRNIDATATLTWNAGAGFQPIGSTASPFTGNFDGLGHAIYNLAINQPGGTDIGLFGVVGANANNVISIRNVGLVGANITGGSQTGGLIGAIDPTGTCGCDTITVRNSYVTGAVAGGNDVGGLVGYVPNADTVALANVHSDAAVSASGTGSLGGLIGYDGIAAITDSWTTGSVTALAAGATAIGGAIGEMAGGSVTGAYATGAVGSNGANVSDIGGLIGNVTGGTISIAYATGNVTTGTGSSAVGGLVGLNAGTLNQTWASGAVSNITAATIGGLVGSNSGTINNSYWDSFTTGQANGFGASTGSVTNLNPVTGDPTLSFSSNYAYNGNNYTNFTAANWAYDNFSTRPMGAWEIPQAQFDVATVASAHGVQLIDANLAGHYVLGQNIDMTGTANPRDVWSASGFEPIGGFYSDIPAGTPFTGVLDGAGHVLSNLFENASGYLYPVNAGLMQDNAGAITNIGLANVSLSAGGQYTGALAGVNSGSIFGSFATGTINLGAVTQNVSTYAGGLVGYNGPPLFSSAPGPSLPGAISTSYATVNLINGGATTGINVGGLVGENEGTIFGSFANGSVSGTNTGGLVGASNNSGGVAIIGSYWDSQLTGQAGACGFAAAAVDCSGAAGLTTAQTLQSSSFAGFAIDAIGGLGLPWRQYNGATTPLLEAFLFPVAVGANSATVQYNATIPSVTANYIAADPALVLGSASLSAPSANVGSYPVFYTGGLYSTQLGYDFVPSTAPGTITITPAPLTIAAISTTRTYDGTTRSAGAPLVSGLFGSDSVTNATQAYTSANVLGADASTLVVNTGYVVNDGNGGGNYTVTLQSAPGTITPAPLTIAAVSTTKTYDGTTSSAVGPMVLGLFGSDRVNNATQAFTSANALGTNASTLVVNTGYVVADGNGGANYTVSLQSASGTITPAPLTIAYVANSATGTYGNVPGVSGTVSIAGLVGSDTLAGVTSGA
ncbi:MAG: hypothetical protein KGK11_11685, partial [Sphingomonadales bacterium]|nr:hypothetical protein [Sphingomonadales bacterium]